MKTFFLSFLLVLTGYSLVAQDCEPNGSIGEAIEIFEGVPIDCFISFINDKDYHFFDAPEPGIMITRITSVPNNINLSTQLIAPNETTILNVSNPPQGEAATLVSSTCVTGPHYIFIEHSAFVNAFNEEDPYTIEVEFIPFTEIDSTECQNNSFGQAALIEFGTSITATIVPQVYDDGSVGEDFDYYRFIVTESGVIQIGINNVPTDLNIGGFLYGPDQIDIIAQNPSPGDNNSSNYTVSVCEPGEYFLILSDEGFSTNSTVDPEEVFDISADFFPFSEYDVLECNNTVATAAELVLCNNEAAIVPRFDTNTSSSDRDYYVKTLNAGDVLKVNINSIVADIGLDVELFSVLQGTIQTFNNDNIISIEYTVTESDDYYILVEADQNSEYNLDVPYTITLDGNCVTSQECSLTSATEGSSINVENNNAQLTVDTDVSPVNYEWRYQIQGDVDWIETLSSGSSSILLDDLNECTDYNWQFRLECTVGEFSEWSANLLFETTSPDCNEGVDEDGDGSFTPLDCDDNDPAINPDATEIPDNDVDENCDGITETSDNLTFISGDATGSVGTTISVPVTTLGFTDISSFQFPVVITDGTLGVITAIEPASDFSNLMFNINGSSANISWFSSASDLTETYPDNTLIANVTIELTGDTGACGSLSFEGDIPVTASKDIITTVNPVTIEGELCVSEFVQFSGRVYREDDTPVNNVIIDCTSGDDDVTDEMGVYELPSLMPGADYTVTPSKDIFVLNGVTVGDLVAINEHILGIQLLDSPYKIIAADVQEDVLNTLTIVDIVVIQSVILGIFDEFPNDESWQFIPADYTFVNPLNPLAEDYPTVITTGVLSGNVTDADFIGIKTGDVTLNADASQFVTPDPLDFFIPSFGFNAGDIVELDFSSSNFDTQKGFQFDLTFDESKVNFITTDSGVLSNFNSSSVGINSLTDGILPVIWYTASGQTKSYNSEERLFTLKFEALTAGRTEDIFAFANLRETAINANNKESGVSLTFTDTATSVSSTFDSFHIGEIYPNPFTKSAYLPIYSETSVIANLSIRDINGRIIHQRDLQVLGGTETNLLLEESMFSGEGVYFYQLIAEGQVNSGKIIHLR